MAQTIQLKRSATAGNVPTSSDLALGEIAINTADGAVYIKKGNNDIVTVHDNDILHIDSDTDNNGAYQKIGIGTTSPVYKLSVDSGTSDWPGYFKSSDNKAGLVIADNDTTGYFGVESSKAFMGLQAGIHANNLNIDNSGNVGIGTTSPNANGSRKTLHINSDTNGSAIRLSQSSNSALIRYGDTDGLEIGTIASKTVKLETNDITALTIDTSQRVGIGTDSPSATLEVSHDNDGTVDIMRLRNGDSLYSQSFLFQLDTSKDMVITGASGSGGIKFVPGSRGVTVSNKLIVGDTFSIREDGTNDEIKSTGNVLYVKANEYSFQDNSGNERISVATNGAIQFNNAYTFPTSDGTVSGQVLQTNANGTLSFGSISGSGVTVSNNANNRVLTGDGVNANAEANLTFDGSNLDLPNDTKIRFGDTNRLQMYHTGSHAFLENTDGNLYIAVYDDDQDIVIRSDDGSGGVTDYVTFDGSATTTVFGQNSRHNNDVRAYFGTSNSAEISYAGGNFVIQGFSGDTKIINYADDKDVILGSDDGSGGTATYFQLDGSQAQLKVHKNMVFFDDIKATFGTGADFGIKHDGSHTYLQNSTGHVYFQQLADDQDIIFQSDDGSGGVTEYLRLDGSSTDIHASKDLKFIDSKGAYFGASNDLQLYHNGSNSLISNQNGDLYIRQQTDDGDIIFQADNGSGGDTTYFTVDGGEGRVVYNVWTRHIDSARILVGTGGDMALFHTGSNSVIHNTTGQLRVRADDLAIQSYSNEENYITAVEDGAVTLYHDNATRFATTSTGVDVTGGLVADSGQIDGTFIVDGGTGVNSTGVLHVRQSGDGDGNGIAITSSNATSHRIWKDSSGNLNIGSSSNSDAFKQDTTGNVTIEGTVTASGEIRSDTRLKTDMITGIQQTGSFIDFDDDTTYGTNGLTLSSLSTVNILFDTNNNDSHTFNVYGNGETTPYLKITNDGDTVFNGEIHAKDSNSSADPTITFTGHTDTGLAVVEISSNDHLYFTTDGTARAYVNNSGLFSQGNLYSANNGDFRNYGGEWHATTGTTGNGFKFTNTADSVDALALTAAGNATFAGSVQGTSFSDGTISGVTFIDEDSFSTNSATRIPTQQSVKAYVDAQVSGVVDSAPSALNTLNELAAALGDDANFSSTTTTALGNRLRVDTASQGLTGTQQANAITNLGITATKAELNYVDGVTSNIQTQLNNKLNTTGGTLTGTLDLNNADSLSFESGKHWITWNDGEGNFNIRVGHKSDSTPNEVSTETGYVFHDEWSQSSGWREFNISASSVTAGADVGTWRKQMYYDSDSVYIAYQGSTKFNTTSAGVSIAGNIAVSGTVDGRDLATDGTKLDTIDTNADVTPSWVPSSNPNYVQSLSDLGVTSTAAELNKLDGVTATTAELNYTDGVTSNIQTQLNNKLSLSGGTLTNKLTMDENGFAVSDAYHSWKRHYSVTSTSPQEILYHDGTSLDNGGVYRFTAHISGTGTDNSATAVYWNENGTWKVNVTAQSGSSSNHPQFRISSTTNKPTIHIDHTSTYTIIIYHEWMQLNEELTGTDNAGFAFGTDGFLGSVNGILRYNSGGTSSTGTTPYSTGHTVWHSGNDGSSSGLDADKLDGLQSGSFLRSDADDTYTGTLTLGTNTNIKLPNSSSYGIKSSTGHRVIDSVDSTLRIGDTGKHSIIRLHGQGSDDFRVYYGATDYEIWHAGNSSQFTSTLNTKLSGIAAGADVTPSWVPSTDPGYLTSSSSSVTNKLPLAGGTMSGNINMNGNNLNSVNLIGFQNKELTDFTGSRQMIVDANDGDSNVPSHGDYAGSYPFGIYFTGDNDASTTTLGSGLVKVWHTGHFKKAHIDYFVGLYDTGVTTTEFDKLDGLTATTTELNYTDGVTSNIQTQLNAKYGSGSNPDFTGANINTSTAATPLMISRSGSDSTQVVKVGVYDTIAEFKYIEDTSNEGTGSFGSYRFLLGGNSGETDVEVLNLNKDTVTVGGDLNLTSGHQIKFNGTALTSSVNELNKLDGFTGTYEDLNYAKDLRATGVTTTEFDKLDGLTATTTELNYTDGVTSNIQTQLNAKANLSGATFTGAINMSNQQIYGLNNLRFNDPGVDEGIKWDSGNLWQIYESPDNQTNAAGNLQFVSGSGSGTRRMTIDTSGNIEVTGVKTDTVDLYNGTTKRAELALESTDNFRISATTGGGAGLLLWGAGGTTPTISPLKEGASVNGEVNLGRSSEKFNDAYFNGTVYGGTFSGSGASLTSLNATQLTSGTIPSARFPDNIFDSYRRDTIDSSSEDFDNYLTTGTYAVNNWSDTNDTVANGPTNSVAGDAYGWGVLKVTNWQDADGIGDGNTGTYVLQEYWPHNTDIVYSRIMWNGTFTGWRAAWGTSNDGAGSGLDADKLDGQEGSYYQPASSALNTSSTAQTKSGVLTLSDRVQLHEIRSNTGQEVIINAGESSSYATGQTSEYVYVNADTGFQVNVSPDNWSSAWAGRKTLSYDATNGLVMSGGFSVDASGNLSATTKSFDIEHPSKEGMRLRYGVLEGPENGVYVRGRTKGSLIQLPDYWVDLVHEDSITVQLTPIGKSSELYVKDIADNKVLVSNDTEYFYYIMAERKDVDRFEVEYEV